MRPQAQGAERVRHAARFRRHCRGERRVDLHARPDRAPISSERHRRLPPEHLRLVHPRIGMGAVGAAESAFEHESGVETAAEVFRALETVVAGRDDAVHKIGVAPGATGWAAFALRHDARIDVAVERDRRLRLRGRCQCADGGHGSGRRNVMPCLFQDMLSSVIHGSAFHDGSRVALGLSPSPIFRASDTVRGAPRKDIPIVCFLLLFPPCVAIR